MSAPLGLSVYQTAFQLSPIVLSQGIATFMPFGYLPLTVLTQALNVSNFAFGTDPLNEFFAIFQPLPGSTLIDQKIGTYPFANQFVAANAVIVEPLQVSMLMIVPAQQPGGYILKTATMMALQFALQQHNTSGGTYVVATPSYFYTNCVMTAMRDVTGNDSKQAQTRWQMDFIQPLITAQQALSALNSSMGQIASGVSSTGATSGLAPTIGFPSPVSLPGAAGAGVPGTVGPSATVAGPTSFPAGPSAP